MPPKANITKAKIRDVAGVPVVIGEFIEQGGDSVVFRGSLGGDNTYSVAVKFYVPHHEVH